VPASSPGVCALIVRLALALDKPGRSRLALFQGLKDSGLKDSEIEGLRDSGIEGFMDSGIPRSMDQGLSRFKDQGFSD
jgi:hypothetical protein